MAVLAGVTVVLGGATVVLGGATVVGVGVVEVEPPPQPANAASAVMDNAIMR
jgi:hypothetical protein